MSQSVLSSSTKHVPILQFYDIGTPATATRIPMADFQSLISWILARGYHPISLSDYAAWRVGAKELDHKQSIVITLWGGFISHYSSAYPWLKANGVKFNLMIPVSFIENEDALATGIYFGVSALSEMLSSNLVEAHSEGYHLRWIFQGFPAATGQIYKADGHNLKWGGIEEFVEDAYSNSPIAGTNASSQAITTTYTFGCAPRQHLDASPAPSQITATHLAIDNLRVLGSSYSPTIQVKAKKSSDGGWTVIRNSWQPDWAQAYVTIALDAPFTFLAGEKYDLQFITQSATSGQHELATLGSRTAGNPKLPGGVWRANTYMPLGTMMVDSNGNVELVVSAGTTGTTAPTWSLVLNGTTDDYTVRWKNLGSPLVAGIATTCASNSNAPGFTSGGQLGGDIYLLEGLAQESAPEVLGRVYRDAGQALGLLAQWTRNRQGGYAFGFPYDTYSASGIFLPATLASLHSVQMFASDLLADRWSLLDPAVYFGNPAQASTPVLAIDSTKGLAAIENQIDAHSGLLWDLVPDWDTWQSFGWVNEFAADYATELKKYGPTWSYLTSPRLRFNADGVTLNAGDVAIIQSFLALPEVLRRPVFARITNEADASIAHNTFLNPSASIAALETLLTTTLPALAGLAIDIEGAASSDRSIASAWITALKDSRDAGFPGKTLVAAVPAKTSDAPSDPWSGWCDYAVWLVKPDYAAPLTYDYSFGAASPGPSSPLAWMQDVLAYASGIVAKSKLIVMMSFYGSWWADGPNWGAASHGNYYDSLQRARTVNATWFWDATNSEWYWVNAAGTDKGYQPTPQSMKVRLEAFAALGYTNFGVWAIGQGDSLFYKYAEGSTAALAPFLKIPQGVEQSINQMEGSGSIGALELEAIDGGGYMTALVSQAKLEGKKATLKVGYPGLDTADFVTLATQRIESVTTLDDATGFRLQCRDLKRSAKTKVFARGDDGFPVSNDHPRTLTANPMDVALAVFQNELGLGQSLGAPESAWKLYDPGEWDAAGAVNPTLIRPNPLVDVEQFLFYRNGIFSGYLMDFAFHQAVESKQFLEYEIFRALGGYLIVLADGRLSPRFFFPPTELSNLALFDERNLTMLPGIERHPIINQVSFRMDYDGSKFQTELLIVDAPSLEKFGLAGQHTIESKGMSLARGGASLAGLTATRIFRRYAGFNSSSGAANGGAVVVTAKSHFMTLTAEVGDLVLLSHRLLPNFETGQRGVSSRLSEVIEKQPNFEEGAMTYRLLDLGWAGGKQLSRVAPQGTPAYTSASSSQQSRYMFVADDATGQYSDGTTAKTIF